MARGKGVSSPECMMYGMMKEFGWTYEEYMNTPRNVIFDLVTIMNSIASVHKAEMEKKK